MSTEFEDIDGWQRFGEERKLHIVRFYGGAKHGVSVQLTPSRGDYFCTDKAGAEKLIEQLSLAFELPTIAAQAAIIERLKEALGPFADIYREQAGFVDERIVNVYKLLAELESK